MSQIYLLILFAMIKFSKKLLNLQYPNPCEPRHEISNNVVCATSKASDQPAHTRSLIRAFASRLNILSVKLLTEHHLEFLRLKGGCTGLSVSTLVKIPHCWKSHVTAQIIMRYKGTALYFLPSRWSICGKGAFIIQIIKCTYLRYELFWHWWRLPVNLIL